MQHAFPDARVRLQDVPFFLRNRLDDLPSQCAVFLHQVVFVDGQLAGFEEDRVGNADFSDVVKLSRLLEHLEAVGRIADLPGDDGRITSNADDVISRVVVAMFGGSGEAQNQLLASRIQLPRTAIHLLLQPRRFAGRHVIVFLDYDGIADSRKQLVRVDRLLQKVARSQIESLFAGRRVRSRCQNQHRYMLQHRIQSDDSQNIHPADFRHADVQEKHVREFVAKQVQRFTGVAGRDKTLIAFHLQMLPKRHHVQRLIVDDHDFGRLVDSPLYQK